MAFSFLFLNNFSCPRDIQLFDKKLVMGQIFFYNEDKLQNKNISGNVSDFV